MWNIFGWHFIWALMEFTANVATLFSAIPQGWVTLQAWHSFTMVDYQNIFIFSEIPFEYFLQSNYQQLCFNYGSPNFSQKELCTYTALLTESRRKSWASKINSTGRGKKMSLFPLMTHCSHYFLISEKNTLVYSEVA